jgi:hypothetical protein
MDKTIVTITEDTKIILDGKEYVLEAGDKILAEGGLLNLIKSISLSTINAIWPSDLVRQFKGGNTVAFGGKTYDPNDESVFGDLLKLRKSR